jgi:hypothetical protein
MSVRKGFGIFDRSLRQSCDCDYPEDMQSHAFAADSVPDRSTAIRGVELPDVVLPDVVLPDVVLPDVEDERGVDIVRIHELLALKPAERVAHMVQVANTMRSIADHAKSARQ